MSEEVKRKQGKNRFKYFYQDENSKGKYLAPIVAALRKEEEFLNNQEKILLEDFKNFEIPLLPAKTVKRVDADGKEVFRALSYYFEKANIPITPYVRENGQEFHQPDPFRNVIDAAFLVVYLHLQKKNRNFEKDGSGQIYDDVLAKYKEKIDFEAWKKGILKDSEKEAADALEREIEILIVGAWAEEIVTEIQTNRMVVKDLDPNKLLYVEAEECNDDENKGGYWNAIADQLDSRQKDSEEIVCGKEIVKNIRESMMRGLIDFIEKKDGRAGEIKRFYKRDEHYKNYKKSGNKDRWVTKILKNELVKTEGDLAVNLVLYFTWLKMDAQIKDGGGNYTLTEFVRYAYKTEKGSVEEKNRINKANYNANKVLFPKITGLLKDEVRAAGQPLNIKEECSYDDDLLEFFYITLAMEFEERMPDKLQKPEILDDLKHEKSEKATSRYFI